MLVARAGRVALALVVALIVVARYEGLAAAPHETGAPGRNAKKFSLSSSPSSEAISFSVRGCGWSDGTVPGRGDQAKIMFGMLVVILGGYRIAGRARVAPSCTYFSATWDAVPRILMSGPLDSNTRVIGSGRAGCRHSVVVIPVTHPLVCCSDRFSCLAFIPALKLPTLITSPEVDAVKLQALDCRHRRLARIGRASRAPDRGAVRFHNRFCRTSPSTKTRSPTAQRTAAGCIKSFRLPNKHRFFAWLFQALRLSSAML